VTWANVVVGNFTGLSGTQVEIAGRAPDGTWWVTGEIPNAPSPNAYGVTNTPWAHWSTLVTWANVVVGNFTGLTGTEVDIAGRDQGGNWWVTGLTPTSSQVASYWFGNWSSAVAWSTVLVGNFGNHLNGTVDIMGRVANGAWWAGVSSGTKFTNQLWDTWTPAGNYKNVVVGNFGNGNTDVAMQDAAGNWWISYSNGNGFTSTQMFSSGTGVPWTNVVVGNFSGHTDGSVDIAGRDAQGNWWVARSTSAGFATPQLWGTWTTTVTWSNVLVGDFTGNGMDDIAGRDPSGNWWISVYNGTPFASSGTDFTTTLWTSPANRWPVGVAWTGVTVIKQP
jgi:hypothetical protein